jgi:hypothetical protein
MTGEVLSCKPKDRAKRDGTREVRIEHFTPLAYFIEGPVQRCAGSDCAGKRRSGRRSDK